MGYVYKYTHKETGKWYIGSTKGNTSNYTGSGLIWKKALKKYGIDSYFFEKLYEGKSYREEEERILKSLDAVNDSLSYNLKNEALGGSFPGKLNGMYGKHHNPEAAYKCGNAFRGKKRPEHSEKMKGKNNPMFGKNEHAHGLVKYMAKKAGKTNIEFYGEEKAKIISENLSKGQMGILKPGTSKAMTGGGNSSAKPVTINNKYYGCIKDAMLDLNLTRFEIKKLGKII